ncbi:MAG: TetR/AcrR family transcriptional regulator [Hyphomicrobiaceae bacterium]
MSQLTQRERILSHGLGVASAQGLDALSIGELARKLDVERSGLTVHFEDKSSLQLGVLEQAAAMFQSDVVDVAQLKPQGEDRIYALFERWIAWSLNPRLKGGCPFVHASHESKSLPSDVRAKLREFLDQWSEFFAEAITFTKQNGAFAKDIDIDQFIFEAYGLYLSHHFWHWSMKDGNAKARTMISFERLMTSAKA